MLATRHYSMVCHAGPLPGQTTCFYGDAPKQQQVQTVLQKAREHYRASLGEAQTKQLAALVAARFTPAMGVAEKLDVMRDELRARVRYLDDPPGLDTIQTLSASLARGAGDCVSLTIAISALAKTLFGKPGSWRIGGSQQDPFEHIWNVIDGVPLDASDPMPASREHGMARKQDLGVGAIMNKGREAIMMIALADTTGSRLGMASGNRLDLNARADQPFRARPPIEPMVAPRCGPQIVRGVQGYTDPLAWARERQKWPQDLRAGLTYGEVATIEQWLRAYGVPALTGNAAVNENYETPVTALAAIMRRFAAMGLARKEEFSAAYTRHLEMFGWSHSKGIPKASTPQSMVAWPLTRGYVAVKDKIAAAGADRWNRYVAAMAINRDLFAEAQAEMGGITPGLQDAIEDVQLEGTAVTGRWENLAGQWRWKGYDLHGRPINESEPLFPAPKFAPGVAAEAERYNGKIMRWLLQFPAFASQFEAQAARQIPRLVGKYNARQKLVYGGQPITSMPPATANALGAVFALFLNSLGVDFRTAFGDSWTAIKSEIDKLPETSAPLTATEPASEGVSGMNPYRKLVGVGAATDAAAPAASAGGDFGSVGDWANIAKLVIGTGLSVYSLTEQQKQAKRDAELKKKYIDVLSQKPATVSAPAASGGEPAGASTGSMALIGGAALLLAFMGMAKR